MDFTDFGEGALEVEEPVSDVGFVFALEFELELELLGEEEEDAGKPSVDSFCFVSFASVFGFGLSADVMITVGIG